MPDEITLEFISRQMAKMNTELRNEMRGLRDDMASMRDEMATMRDEIHVLSGWMRRTDERIRRIEDRR